MRSIGAIRLLRSVVAGIVLGCVTGLAPGVAVGRDGTNHTSAEELASVIWPGVRAATGPELVTVDLRTTKGARFDGAVIVASLWPSGEERHAMKVGETFNLTPIDRVTVRRGRATIRAANLDILRAHASRDGVVKVHLDVYTNDGRTTVLMAERIRERSGRWVDAAARDVTRPSRGAAPVRFTLLDHQLAPVVLRDGPAATSLGIQHHQGATCSVMEYAGVTGVAETVATAAVYKGIKADVTYLATAHTRSDLGAQLGGGAWYANGTSNVQSTLTATFVTVTGASTGWSNKEYRATWNHERWWRHCVDPYDTTWPYNDQWITQRFTEPVKVVGFPPIINSRYPLPGCVKKQDLSGVSSIETENHAASSYVAGFTITWGVGSFSGSSQSGYSSTVKIKYSNPVPGTYWYWCGDTSAPQDSYRVRAGR